MSGSVKFLHSSVGAKIVMALTGFLLFVYVVAHMVGNLQVFQGPAKLNAYAEFLHSHMGLLWTARLGILAIIVLHVYSSTRLTLNNRAVRPVPYALKKSVEAGFASRNMYITGAMIFFFLVFHLAQFTLRWTNPEYASLQDPLNPKGFDVYRMVIIGFQDPIVSISYIIAMALLALHLWHGVSSMFQSMGFNKPRYNKLVGAAGPVFASLIIIGNVSMPLAVLLGVVR